MCPYDARTPACALLLAWRSAEARVALAPQHQLNVSSACFKTNPFPPLKSCCMNYRKFPANVYYSSTYMYNSEVSLAGATAPAQFFSASNSSSNGTHSTSSSSYTQQQLAHSNPSKSRRKVDNTTVFHAFRRGKSTNPQLHELITEQIALIAKALCNLLCYHGIEVREMSCCEDTTIIKHGF